MDTLSVFRGAIDALPYGVTLWRAETEQPGDLRLVYANPQASREANLELGEFLGQTVNELLTRFGHPAQAKGQRLARRGVHAALKQQRQAIRIRHPGRKGKDFRVHFVPVWERTVAIVYDAMHGPAEDAEFVEHSQALFEDIVHTLREPLVVLDGSLQIVWASPMFLDYFALSEVAAQSLPIVDVPGGGFRQPSFRELLERVLPKDEIVEDFELELTAPQQEERRTIVLNARRLQRLTEDSPLIFVAFQDVTDERREARVRRQCFERLAQTRDEERRWLARELHDHVSQTLASLSVGLRRLEKSESSESTRTRAEELARTVEQLSDDVQRITKGLHPFLLEQLGFEPAVRQYLDEFGKLHGLEVDIAVTGFGTRAEALDDRLALSLYRMIQEALSNVARHARAGRTNIVLHREPKRLRIIVEDDGIGFDTKQTVRSGGGLGLVALRERASLLGGELTVESTKGRGTTLVITIPLDATKRILH